MPRKYSGISTGCPSTGRFMKNRLKMGVDAQNSQRENYADGIRSHPHVSGRTAQIGRPAHGDQRKKRSHQQPAHNAQKMPLILTRLRVDLTLPSLASCSNFRAPNAR